MMVSTDITTRTRTHKLQTSSCFFFALFIFSSGDFAGYGITRDGLHLLGQRYGQFYMLLYVYFSHVWTPKKKIEIKMEDEMRVEN